MRDFDEKDWKHISKLFRGLADPFDDTDVNWILEFQHAIALLISRVKTLEELVTDLTPPGPPDA